MSRRGPYRVVQWSTGSVGASALRAIVEHPDLELVGVLVSDPAKVGHDAGELCGIGPTGIVAITRFALTSVIDAVPASSLAM